MTCATAKCPQFIHTQNLNTPRLVADDTQKTVWKWEQQEPFGAGACNPDPDGDNVQFEFNLRFPGQYFDRETNQHYNYFRDYDPTSGRYVQSDPIGMAGGLNTYAYSDSDPARFADPMGLAKRIKGRWVACNDEDWAFCRTECGSRGVKSCRHFYYVATELVGGKIVEGLKAAPKPSCNCNEICGDTCKGAIIMIGIGIAICTASPPLTPFFMFGAGVGAVAQ